MASMENRAAHEVMAEVTSVVSADVAADPLAVLPAASGPGDPYARTAETFPRLSDDQVERVAAFGVVENLPVGEVLFEIGDHGVDFFLVLKGFVEIYETSAGGEPQVMTVHAEHQFTGELDLFNDRTILVGGRMGVDGRVARLDRAQFRRMTRCPSSPNTTWTWRTPRWCCAGRTWC